MKNSDRANKRKWEAVATYLLKLREDPRISLTNIAIQYKLSQSTLSYGLTRLIYPTVDNISKINNNPTIHFKQMLATNSLTPSYIKELYDRCNIPIPAILRDAVDKEENNNSVQIEPTPKEETTPAQDCVNCGTTLIPKARFCHSCGHPVLISKQRALDICDCVTEVIKAQFTEQHQTTYLYALARIRDYIEHTEE